jgi:hypothetical protein
VIGDAFFTWDVKGDVWKEGYNTGPASEQTQALNGACQALYSHYPHTVGWKHPQSHTAIILSPDKYSFLYPGGILLISTSVVHNNSSSFSNAVLFSVSFHKLITIIYLDDCMLLLKYWCYSNFFADLPAFYFIPHYFLLAVTKEAEGHRELTHHGVLRCQAGGEWLGGGGGGRWFVLWWTGPYTRAIPLAMTYCTVPSALPRSCSAASFWGSTALKIKKIFLLSIYQSPFVSR